MFGRIALVSALVGSMVCTQTVALLFHKLFGTLPFCRHTSLAPPTLAPAHPAISWVCLVGLYIGNRQFLHAEKKAGRVVIADLKQPWYAKRFLGARRIKELSKNEETF